MADSSPPARIPDAWRQSVLSILASNDRNRIIWRRRPREETSAKFPNAWLSDFHSAMARTLRQTPVTGKLILGMNEPGETWAFFTMFAEHRLYAKINLLPDHRVIILYSLHPPNHGDQL